MATARESPPAPATPPATTAATPPRVIRIPAATVLRGVSYDEYVRLRADRGNAHLRMTFHDGTLKLMSPEFIHEVPSHRLGIFVTILAGELEIPCTGAASTTFRRRGDRPGGGHGREADQSFYLAHADRLVGKQGIDLDAGDPPPDLWVEVDNRASSRGRLPVYAALGVPEVWRYHARKETLRFDRLVGGGYEPIERSLALPMLTPALVLDALALGRSRFDSAWYRDLKAWIGAKFGPPAPPA